MLTSVYFDLSGYAAIFGMLFAGASEQVSLMNQEEIGRLEG